MKPLAAILVLTASLGLHAGAQDPLQTEASKTAVSYLKLLTQNKYFLDEHTAISNHCELSRRKEIRDELEFYRKTKLHDGDIYSLEDNKVEGQFSALLLRAENPKTPLRTRIHSIAMLKRDGKWLPAPLLGTFSNTGYGYDLDIEKTVKDLEKWMAQEKIKRETSARTLASNKILKEISLEAEKIELTNISPEQSAIKLIEAIRSKNLLQAMAIMGMSSDKPSEPLESTVDTFSRGLLRDEPENEWLLIRQHAVSQVVNLDETKKEVAIGFWDPLAKTPDKILYFPYYEVDGKTYTKLPETLKLALLSQSERLRQRWKHRRKDETILRKKTPVEIFKNIPVTPHKNTQKLFDEVVRFHKEENFTKVLSLLARDDKFFSDEENQKLVLEELSQIWRSLHTVRSLPMQALQIFEEGEIALAPLQFAKTNRPGEFTTIQIWMIKLENSWHIITENYLIELGGKETERIMTKLEKRLLDIQKKYQEQQSRELMSQVTRLNPPLELNATSEDEAKAIITQFRKLLRSKDTAAALSLCSVLEDTSSKETLRNFNYAIRGAADHVDEDQIMGINQSGKWTGISVKTVSKSSNLVDYPLYVIVNSNKGSKILLDIDLRYATNRGRELINSKIWKKLGKALPQENLNNMKKLFETHKELSSTDIEKNNPQKEEE